MLFLNVRTRFCCRYLYSHPSRGGDQQQLVTASLRFIPLLNNIGRVNNAVRLSPLWGRRTALLLGGENDQYWSVVGAVLVAFSSLAGEWEGYLL